MPRILVTMDQQPDYDAVRLRRDYSRRLREAGGLPLLLPHTEQPLSPETRRPIWQAVTGCCSPAAGTWSPGATAALPGRTRI